MEFNSTLFLLFIGYIASLVAGFGLYTNRKDSIAKKYNEYKLLLISLLVQIHLLTIGLFLYVGTLSDTFYLLAVVELILLFFVLYMFKYETRCDVQHFTVIHNFLLIPLVYFSYLIFPQIFLVYILILIYTYNILMFQFAKYNHKKFMMWD